MSRATYREFRGQRRRTVPSQFLMELPRGEMHLVEPSWTGDVEWEAVDEAEEMQADELHVDLPDEAAGPSTDESTPARVAAPGPLVTAAELQRAETTEAPRVSPDVFHQGMVVRHPQYGLGKVVALSGGGAKRSATVAFASMAGQKKFMLALSPLRPAKTV